MKVLLIFLFSNHPSGCFPHLQSTRIDSCNIIFNLLLGKNSYLGMLYVFWFCGKCRFLTNNFISTFIATMIWQFLSKDMLLLCLDSNESPDNNFLKGFTHVIFMFTTYSWLFSLYDFIAKHITAPFNPRPLI